VIAPSLRAEDLLRDRWPLEVAKDGRVRDPVVGGNGAEGLHERLLGNPTLLVEPRSGPAIRLMPLLCSLTMISDLIQQLQLGG
jgi:hypothetical protein